MVSDDSSSDLETVASKAENGDDLSGVEPGRGIGRDVLSAIAASTTTSFAVFLTGALAVQMGASLHFGPDSLGMAVSIYYLGAAAGSVPFGRLTEAVGGARVMKPTALLAGTLLALIALLAHSWVSLSVVLFFSGIVSSAMQPATNLFLARRIPRDRQGFAFGVKQSAIPFASLFGGLAVPAIALTIGWRWAFAFAALCSGVTALLVPRSHTSLASYRAKHKDPASPGRIAPLVVLGVGFGLGIFAAAAMTAFLVTSGVAGGLSKPEAGYLAGAAGAVAVMVRVYSGVLADRRGGGHFKVIALMLVMGCLGYIGLALGSAFRVYLFFWFGAIIAYGAGWGWNGLFNFAVIRTHTKAPARATSVTQVGGRLASVFGPLVFGVVVAHGSYAIAWLVNGLVAVLGAGVILYGRHMLMRPSREAGPAPS